MKKILSENELRRLVESAVRNVLNEMGTPRQNDFLRSLMGDRYQDEYDNLPPQQSSQMIQAELDRQKAERGSHLATQRQLSFIANNKYYPIPTITKIEGQLTKADAGEMITALNPYSNSRYNYYGPVRRRKEQWIPNMKEVVVPLLQKYGLNDEAQTLAQYADEFMTKNNLKQERAKERENKRKWEDLQNNPNTLIFISTQDEANMREHANARVSTDFYMDGVLEEKMGWDMLNLATDMTQKQLEDIRKAVQERGILVYPCIVLGYDKPCDAVFWMGYDFARRYDLCGRVVDHSQWHDAYEFAKKCLNGSSEGKRLGQ